MFRKCINLTSIDLSNFNTNNLETASSMFEECKELTSIDLSSFMDTKLKNISNIFFNCPSLKYIDISSIKWNNKKKVNISNFLAESGQLIITENLLSSLDTKPKDSWEIINK